MKQEILYIKDTGSFLKKLRATGEIPKGVILVAWRGVAWLYSGTPHELRCETLAGTYRQNRPYKRHN